MSKTTEPYDKPGYKPPIRCHKCGMYKTDEDAGVYLVFQVKDQTERPRKVWFHNREHKDIWVADNAKNISVIDESEHVQEQNEKSNESQRKYQE